MSAEYVRRFYRVDYKRGERLTVEGRPGTLVSFPGQYLGVRFDGENFTSRCHPTWEVAREIKAPRATTGPCPICALPSGFHGPACHDYTRPKTTRAPGRDAFDAWAANARKDMR